MDRYPKCQLYEKDRLRKTRVWNPGRTKVLMEWEYNLKESGENSTWKLSWGYREMGGVDW